MLRATISLCLLCAGCGVAKQPEWSKTVAAYEVPLPTSEDKSRFLELLTKEAKAQGYHVDAATPQELKNLSEVSPMTLSAAVWRGKDDEEAIASAMDFEDRIGRVWVTFSLGQDPVRSSRFKDKLVPEIKGIWPETRSLPIMPNGAIPLTNDLVRSPSGYSVKPAAASKYQTAAH
ncbi:MAG: hypothetical protein ACKOUT_05285 [Novosphingobium sp.]